MKLGPYAIEQDYSHYVSKASEIIFAVVGTATKGPIGVPTLVTSPRDLVNKFGGVNTDCLGLYAANYFLNQSSRLWYVRAAASSAASATVKIAGTASGGTAVEALVLQTTTKGSYYNDYKVTVEANTDGTFNITLKGASGAAIERISNLSMETIDTTFKSSYLVYVSHIKGAVITAGDYTLTGGDAGISGITADDFISAGKNLVNDSIDMNLFAVPGVSDSEVISEMLTVAETRGDCVYLIDPPNNLTPEQVAAWHNGVQVDKAYVNGNEQKFNSSYGAVYYAWQTIYDSVNGVSLEVPPSVVVAPTIAKSARDSEVWYPVAGLQRGVISGALTPVFSPDTTTVNTLYTEENSVNCIIRDPQVGLCIFGQKTLSREDSALNRLNVRMLLNYLKRIVVAACRHLTFEPNDRVTWNRFEDMVTPVLDHVKNNRGVYDYQVVKGEMIVSEEDIDNYRMPCKILVKPTKAAEDIPIYFTITNTGADFDEILSRESTLDQTL